MTPLRILFVAPSADGIGGVLRSAARIIDSLRSLGHTVLRINPDPFLFPNERMISETMWSFNQAESLQHFSEEAHRAILEWKPDAVIGWYASTGGYAGISAAARKGIPSLLCLRGNDIDRDFFIPDRLPLIQWAISNATQIACVSTEMQSKCLAWFQRESHFISNSVNPTQFYPDESAATEFKSNHGLGEGPILGLFGEFKRKRGLEILSQITDELERWQLVIIGQIRKEVEHQIPPFAHRIDYLHDINQLRAAYSACDAVMQPSHHDGMPNVVLEALACGSVVLASKAGGLADIPSDKHSIFHCVEPEEWRTTLRAIRDGAFIAPSQRLLSPIEEAKQYEQVLYSLR